MILRAPISFFIMMVVGWGIIVHLSRLYYNRQLANKDSTIGLLQQRVEYVSEISSKLKDEEKSSTSLASIREGLGAYVTVGDNLWAEGMSQVTENTRVEWNQRIQAWVMDVVGFLRNNLSEAEVALFANATGLEPKIFDDTFSAEHNSQLLILRIFIGNLRQILRNCR